MECARLSHLILFVVITLVLSGSIVPCDANFNAMPEGKRRVKHRILGDDRMVQPPYNKPPDGRRQRVEVNHTVQLRCLFIPFDYTPTSQVLIIYTHKYVCIVILIFFLACHYYSVWYKYVWLD